MARPNHFIGVVETAAVAFTYVGLLVLSEDCSDPSRATRPAAYGVELATCEHESRSWAEYVPCCQDVARRYGRPPTACADGGTP